MFGNVLGILILVEFNLHKAIVYDSWRSQGFL